MDDFSEHLDYLNINRDVDCRDYAYEVSDENKNSIGIWTRGCPCYTLANNQDAFCPCLESLCEVAFNTSLSGGGNLRQHSIQAAAWVLLTASGQFYCENQEQRGEEQKDLENLYFVLKMRVFKGIVKKGEIAKKIIIIRKKSSILHWDSKKKCLNGIRN